MHITLQLLFLKSMLILTESAKKPMKPFVVKGHDADIIKYPHSCYLGVECYSSKDEFEGGWMCGSSIVSQVVTLTAAHCLYTCSKYSSVTASVGNVVPLKGATTRGYNFLVHEDYNDKNEDIVFDICLVKLKRPLVFQPNVQRVAIMKNPPKYEEAVVAGWGLYDEVREISSSQLQYAKQIVLDKVKCLQTLKSIPKGTFCTRPFQKEGYAAPGDSGSALVTNDYIQIGLVSYKVPTKSKKIIVYTNTSYYYSWIEKNIYKVSCK